VALNDGRGGQLLDVAFAGLSVDDGGNLDGQLAGWHHQRGKWQSAGVSPGVDAMLACKGER